jgi:hypothetical protein
LDILEVCIAILVSLVFTYNKALTTCINWNLNNQAWQQRVIKLVNFDLRRD